MNPYIVPGLVSKDELIDKIICNVFDVDDNWLHTRSRKRIGVEARQFVMWWRDNNTKESQKIIGARYGGRDHSTVVHACKTVNNLMKTNKVFREKAEDALIKLEHLKF